MATRRKIVLQYETELVRLVKAVSKIESLLEFDELQFKESFKSLPLKERISIFLRFTEIHRDLLEMLRKTFPLKIPAERGPNKPK